MVDRGYSVPVKTLDQCLKSRTEVDIRSRYSSVLFPFSVSSPPELHSSLYFVYLDWILRKYIRALQIYIAKKFLLARVDESNGIGITLQGAF